MAKELDFLKYQLASYEEYFPFLEDYGEAILAEAVDLRKDAIADLQSFEPSVTLGFLTREEYERMSDAQKFQLALDRYCKKHKTNVEIGRCYERYIGYLYEMKGWKVYYQGAIKQFEDFGRDLICKKGASVEIVQCKYWSRYRLIREKHIFQLFGTCFLYKLTAGQPNAVPVFATNIELSSDAKAVADGIGVQIFHKGLADYPMIKCNVNTGNGSRIYHLPFDQQYDRVVIEPEKGEFYARTIKEAEAKGFRRAHRWRGNE